MRTKFGFIFLFACIVIICFTLPDPLLAVDKNEWSQYRLNSENNPVIKTDRLKNMKSIINTDDQVRSTPVVVGNRIFVGNHDSGNLSAYNLNSGDLLWENQAPNWVHSEIIYANNQLFVGYGNRFFKDNLIRGTGESGLISMDPETGEILWDFKTDGEVMPTPAFYDGIVYITTGDEHLYGVDPKSGKEIWSLNLGSVISMSSPNIKDGILYVGGSHSYVFKAVDLDDREIKWETPLVGVMAGLDDVPPVVSDKGIVYTTGVENSDEALTLKQIFDSEGLIETYKHMIKLYLGDFLGKQLKKQYEHKIYAMDIQSGKVIWEKSMGIGAMVPNNKSGAPMLYDDSVFVGSPITESFYAYDADDGDKLWQYKSFINKAPPVADDDVVYFTDTKGLVYAFDTDSGDLLGKKELGGKLAPSGPILVNDYLIVGSQDSNVYNVPTEEILQSDDSADDGGNLFSYIALVYVLPIGLLLLVIGLIGLVVRLGIKWMKM